MPRWNTFLFSLSLLTACSSSVHETIGVAASDNRAAATPNTATAFGLISPATCASQGAHLQSCKIPAQTLTFKPIESAVPLRTTVSAHMEGNCASPLPLQVALTADNQSAVQFAYLAGGSAVVRRDDGGSIASLALVDSSARTRSASFDTSCRIVLSISANEIDCDSKAEAQAILQKLQSELADKQKTTETLRGLVLYARAFGFLKEVANNFLDDLTNESLQELRAATTAAQPALERVINDSGSLSFDQKLNLFKLNKALSTLDHPEDWKSSDGSCKRLSDVLGADAKKVIATINLLASSPVPDNIFTDGGTVDYDGLLADAVTDAGNVQEKIELAKQQLASFLE
jgi:hypothetical protein